MNKFKLINQQTNEEYICDKVTIGNFNYYVVDNIATDTNYFIQSISLFKRINESNVRQEWRTTDFIHGCSVKTGLNYSFDSDDKSCKKVIATNNPNIDIPKVIDEIKVLSLKLYPPLIEEDWDKNIQYRDEFIEGYNKSQQDFPFSENDMIEFGDWLINVCNSNWELNKNCYITGVASTAIRNTKELFDIWKEQQLKVLYYEV